MIDTTTVKGNELRVAVCVPSGDMLHADFALSLAALCMKAPVSIALINVKSSLIPTGRNMLVQQAMAVKATHMLFLDSDMVFPQDTIERLLSHAKYIVGGTYAQRVTPFRVLGNTLDNQPIEIDTGLLEMSRMPTGCLMIHMSVFDKLRMPYFRVGIDEEAGTILSEDLEFCDRAREAGFNIYCDVDLSKELLHLGQQAIGVQHQQEIIHHG